MQISLQTANPSYSPASPEQAENLARKAVGDYLTACTMAGYQPEAVGNYLQMLATVAGMIMAKAEGSSTAVRRMESAAKVVHSLMPVTPDGPDQWPSYDPQNPTRFELLAESVPTGKAAQTTAQPPASATPALAPARDLAALRGLFSQAAERT